MKCRVWDRPAVGEKVIARTGNGSYVIDGTSGVWTRQRSRPEEIARVLRAEFERCGYSPKTLKVRAFGDELFLNLGALRGLDPNVVYRTLTETYRKEATRRGPAKILKRFPDRCGVRRVLEALGRLEQRVERAPAHVLGEPEEVHTTATKDATEEATGA